MSCEKQSWTQSRASSRHNNAAKGDNPRPSFDDPKLFLETNATSPGVLRSYKVNDRQVILTAHGEQGGVRLRATYDDGFQLFSILQSDYPNYILEGRGWLVSTSVFSTSTRVFDAASGFLIGEIPMGGIVFESAGNDAVLMVEQTDIENDRYYEFYLLDLDEENELQSTFLWSSTEVAGAYDPQNDNLLFPRSGVSRELLTGNVLWNHDQALGDPYSPLASYFDYQGNAYILYQELGIVAGPRVYLKKLAFPSATTAWAVDLSQYLPNSEGPDLWGSQGAQRPFGICVTDNYIWFLQNQIKLGRKAQDASFGLPPDVQAHMPWHDTFHSELRWKKIRTASGALAQDMLLPDHYSDGIEHKTLPLCLGGNSPDEDWVLLHTLRPHPESESEETPLYLSSLFLAQGTTIVANVLAYDSELDEWGSLITDPRILTDTVLPHYALAEACIVGGSVYFYRRDIDDTYNVYRMGLHYRCDSQRRYQANPDPCYPPGPVTLLGDTKIPAGSVGEFNLSFSSCDSSNLPLSMGYGWHLDAYKKLLIGPSALEFLDGTGGYEQWELFKGDWVPVHKDNHVKAVSHSNGTHELTFPDYSKMLFDEHGRLQTWTDRSGNVLTYVYEEVQNPEEEAAARLIEVNDGHGRKTLLEYATPALVDRQPVKIIEVERGETDQGRETILTYDSVTDVLTSVTDPNNETTQYQYDIEGRMWKIITPDGRVAVEYSYDNDGRVKTAVFNGQSKHTYSYNLENRVTSTVMEDLVDDSPARTMAYEYDLNYRVIKETDSLDNVTRTEYNDPRHPTLPTRRVAPDLSVTQWGYNDEGNVAYEIDAQDNRTDFEYAEDIGPSGPQYRNLLRKVKWIFRGSRSLVSRHVDHPYRTKSITFWHRYQPVISRATNLLSFRF